MTIDFVIDNSALIEFFTSKRPDPGLQRRILTSRASAPELLDAEALHSLRKMIRNGVLSEEHARQTLMESWLEVMAITRRSSCTRVVSKRGGNATG